MNSEVRPGYKLTESGMIPEEWESVSLGDTIKLQRGFDLPHRLRCDGDIPVVSSAGITATHNKAQAEGPGVVTGRYGTIGEVFFVESEYWPLNTTLYVKDFKGNSQLFIYYLLKTVDFKTHSGKSGVPGVNRNDLHELVIAKPPISQQRAIAAALSDMDALISGLNQLIAKKRDIKKATMQQLLSGLQRLPGYSGKWEVKRLGDVLRVRHGKSQSAIEVSGGKYPILATGGEIGRTDTFLYDKPSVLIGRKGTIDRPIYRDEPFWSVDTLFYTEIAQEAVPVFIYYKFLMIDWRSYNEASGVPSLNASTIEAVDIVIPDMAEQTAIAAILCDMDKELTTLETRRDKARQLKQGIMQELLTGRIRLSQSSQEANLC